MSKIDNATVVITGGASGIGRLMALGFAAKGATVAVWDLNAAGARVVAKELAAATGREHAAYEIDVTDRAAVYETGRQTVADLGEVDIVVNNAGIISGGAALIDTPDEEIERTFAVNALALFWVTKAFLPAMIERNSGHVVTIASASGMIGVSHLVEYASSKNAAIGFDESLRVEMAEMAPGVKTTVVNPYFIDTGMFEGVRTRFPFLLPILKEQDVADSVIDAVSVDRRRVVLPPAVNLIPPARVLPIGLFDRVMTGLGVNDTMKTFKGRG